MPCTSYFCPTCFDNSSPRPNPAVHQTHARPYAIRLLCSPPSLRSMTYVPRVRLGEALGCTRRPFKWNWIDIAIRSLIHRLARDSWALLNVEICLIHSPFHSSSASLPNLVSSDVVAFFPTWVFGSTKSRLSTFSSLQNHLHILLCISLQVRSTEAIQGKILIQLYSSRCPTPHTGNATSVATPF